MLFGFLVILQTAWFAWCSPSAAYRGWTTYGSALWACFKQQHALALRVIPPIGWFSLFGQTYLPLLLLLLLRPRLRAKRGPVYLYFLMTVLLVAVLLEASFLSPLRLLNAEGRIDLVFGTPYIAVAMAFGLLAGVWWSRLRHEVRLISPWFRAMRNTLRLLFLPLFLLFFSILGWRHFSTADGRVSRISHEWTKGILQSLGPRRILVADSWINSLVSLESRATGAGDLRVISPDLAGATPYLRWLTTWQDTPALQSLATVGVGPLLQGMLTSDPPMFDQLALHWQDAPMAACGLEAVPAADLFLPAAAGTPPEDPARWGERSARLDALPMERLAHLREARHPFAPFAAEWLRIQSKLTNNHGVALAGSGRNDLADEAYRAALRLYPDNVSALLNRVELSRTASPPPPDIEQIHRDFAKFMEDLGTGRYRIWALASAYGMLAAPEAFADRGLYWAVSGRPARAIQDLRRAMDMAGEDTRLQVAVAGALFAGGDPIRAAEEYTRVLKNNPADRNALTGLARIAALQGNYTEARASLSRLAEGREPESGLLVDLAVVDLLEGLDQDALEKAERATEIAAGDARAWTLLASLSARAGDAGEFNRAIERMQRMSTLAVHTRHAIAALLWQQGRSDEARRLARSILENHPAHMPTLDLSLRMAVAHRDHVTARLCIPRILETEPANAYALMILGSLHYFEHRLAPAEQAFRASLAVERSQESLNSLAFVLYELNRSEEALPLAEEALSLNRVAPETWDTLAMIHLSMGRLDEAMNASRKAVELAPELLDLQLHLAMIHTERGELEPAWNLVEQLMVRKAALSSPAQTRLDTFRVKLQRLREAKSAG
jgi:tetratricopeptide (TPR) repeat protein